MKTALDDIGQALADVMARVEEPPVAKVLGASYVTELRTAAAGFRQRFPSNWPGSQQQLPLEGET